MDEQYFYSTGVDKDEGLPREIPGSRHPAKKNAYPAIPPKLKNQVSRRKNCSYRNPTKKYCLSRHPAKIAYPAIWPKKLLNPPSRRKKELIPPSQQSRMRTWMAKSRSKFNNYLLTAAFRVISRPKNNVFFVMRQLDASNIFLAFSLKFSTILGI